MEKKRPIGVTVFGILIILGALFQIISGLDFARYKFLFQPLPEQLIRVRYFITMLILVLSLVSGVGVLFLENIFRRIILFTAFYSLYTYLLEAPFFCFRNYSNFIIQESMGAASKIPDISTSTYSATLWAATIFFWVVDFSFAICLIYYFTRPKVEDQFE